MGGCLGAKVPTLPRPTTSRHQASASHHKNGIFNLAFGHEDRTILTASGDQTCRVWDLEQNACRARLFGHMEPSCIRSSNKGLTFWRLPRT